MPPLFLALFGLACCRVGLRLPTYLPYLWSRGRRSSTRASVIQYDAENFASSQTSRSQWVYCIPTCRSILNPFICTRLLADLHDQYITVVCRSAGQGRGRSRCSTLQADGFLASDASMGFMQNPGCVHDKKIIVNGNVSHMHLCKFFFLTVGIFSRQKKKKGKRKVGGSLLFCFTNSSFIALSLYITIGRDKRDKVASPQTQTHTHTRTHTYIHTMQVESVSPSVRPPICQFWECRSSFIPNVHCMGAHGSLNKKERKKAFQKFLSGRMKRNERMNGGAIWGRGKGKGKRELRRLHRLKACYFFLFPPSILACAVG
ncbi:hypothetical protein GGR50DRAFT_537056 [Xylaria sp. CBS 124048]|nr:hypothetical protein GGR50DRAFT_537056 [Xylaria sp. CBS 124048]